MLFRLNSRNKDATKTEIEKPSFITSDKFASLREGLLKIEKEKEGKGSLVSAYYNLKEWSMYAKQARQSVEYHNEYFDCIMRGARIGTFIGIVYGVVCGDESVKSVVISAGSFAFLGGVINQISLLPVMYKDFKNVKIKIDGINNDL